MTKVWYFFSNSFSCLIYSVIAFIYAILPEESFMYGFIQCTWPDWIIISVNRIIVFIVLLIIANLINFYYRKFRKKVSIKSKNYSIIIEYGDILQVKSGKKVINFDECFTTKIGDRPEDIKADSICGQYLTKFPIDSLHHLIESAGAKPSGKSQFNNKDIFKPGTIIPRGDFLLMAFAKLDRYGLGQMTYEQYIECLNNLWVQIDRYHGTDDVYIPVLGSHITRFDRELTQQELLDIMISSYRLSTRKLKLPNRLFIVCKAREGFSLNDIFGV